VVAGDAHGRCGGDHVLIDVSHDQVKVNGRVVYHQNLESKHAHSIFFQ
jgi:hypothetical protein